MIRVKQYRRAEPQGEPCDTSRQRSAGLATARPLEQLPFPAVFAAMLEYLTVCDAIRFSSTSNQNRALVSSMMRKLTLHDRGGPCNRFPTILRRCSRLETLKCTGLGLRGATRLAAACQAHPLRWLRRLEMANNHLGEQGIARFVPCLALLPRLEAFILDANSLGNKGLCALTTELRRGSCARLRTLSLALNGIGSVGAQDLAMCLKSGACSLLECLCLDGNLIGPAGMADLARAFRAGACKAIRELNFRNNGLHSEGLNELLGAFVSGSCDRLEVLNLDSNILGGSGARMLAQAFSNGATPNLLRLNLNATFVGEAGTRELAHAFRSGACQRLRQLHLGNACLRDNGVSELVNALEDGSLGGNLQVLVLDLNNIGVEGSRVLAQAFKSGRCAALQELHIASVKLTSQTLDVLVGALKSGACPSLQALSLASDQIGDSGVERLSEVLSAWQVPRLASLFLQDNCITDVGMTALARALALGTCSALQVLRLDANRIEAQGARELADAMVAGALPRMVELHMRTNLLRDAGLKEIVRGATYCPELQVLNLESNSIGLEGVMFLCEALEGHERQASKYKELLLKHNHLRDVGVVARLIGVFAGYRTSQLQVLSLGSDDNLLTTLEHHLVRA